MTSSEPIWETFGIFELCSYKACDQRPSGDVQSYCNTPAPRVRFLRCPSGFEGSAYAYQVSVTIITPFCNVYTFGTGGCAVLSQTDLDSDPCPWVQ